MPPLIESAGTRDNKIHDYSFYHPIQTNHCNTALIVYVLEVSRGFKDGKFKVVSLVKKEKALTKCRAFTCHIIKKGLDSIVYGNRYDFD